jgi:hypothetical protein
MKNQLEAEVVVEGMDQNVVEALNNHMWRIILVSQLLSPMR